MLQLCVVILSISVFSDGDGDDGDGDDGDGELPNWIKNLFKISGESKPVLTEIGPYAYEQKMERTDLKFSEDGTNIGYKIATRYFFSKGTIMLLEATVANDTFIVGSYNVIPLLNLLK